MSSSLNKVFLIGHVGQDPIIRSTSNTNKKIASFSLATSDSFKDKSTGERKKNTHWHKIVVFNEMLVDFVEKYVRKGSHLYLQGHLQTRKWEDDKQVTHYTTEICLSQFKGELIILDKRDSVQQNGNHFSEGEALSNMPLPADFNEINDEIPF